MIKIVAPLVLVAVLVTGTLVYLRTHSSENPNVIAISGNIEATTVEISFRIPGWVKARYVDEGWSVTAGQVVAMLDNAEYVRNVGLSRAGLQQAESALAELLAGSRPEEIAQAEAGMKKAESFWQQLVAGSRPGEIAQAEEAVNAAKAEAERLGTDYQRAASLYKRDRSAISNQDYLAAKAAWDVAQAQHREAQARWKLVKEGPRKEEIAQARSSYDLAKASYELVKAGPRREAIDQARARVAQAKESLGLAETRLDYTTLRAPDNGIVLSKSTEPGEYVSPGTPIVTAADLHHVWLRGYVDETDLARVKLGQKAEVTTDSYPGKVYEGRISFISSQAEFTPKTVQTQKERVKLVFRVKIDLDNPSMELKPGMPADARILLQP